MLNPIFANEIANALPIPEYKLLNYHLMIQL